MDRQTDVLLAAMFPVALTPTVVGQQLIQRFRGPDVILHQVETSDAVLHHRPRLGCHGWMPRFGIRILGVF